MPDLDDLLTPAEGRAKLQAEFARRWDAVNAVLADLDEVDRRARDRKDRTHWDTCWLEHNRCLAARIRRTLTGEDPS